MLEEQKHDPSDFQGALQKAYQFDEEIPIGLLYKNSELPSLEDLEPVLHDGSGPLALRKLGISKEQADAIVQELL
jgi:hypothetical protein